MVSLSVESPKKMARPNVTEPDCTVPQSLQRLSGLLEAQDMDGRADFVWLLDCFANVSDADLAQFASYGQGIGPEKASPPAIC